MKCVHLFDPDRGSRYPLMISQGLLVHEDVSEVRFNAPVISLGEAIAKALPEHELKQALTEADLIFRPSNSHFGLDQWEDFIDQNDLWPKVIYYDFKDTEQMDWLALEKCRLYVKRSWDGRKRGQRLGKVIKIPYGVLDEYLYFERADHIERNIDVAYLITPNPKNPAEASRYKVFEALTQWRGHDLVMRIGQDTRDGRRAIFDPPEGNPFIKYLRILRRSKIVITIEPDHHGGDSRLWEALASGAMVMSNYDDGCGMVSPVDPGNQRGLDNMTAAIRYILKDRPITRKITAYSGYNEAMLNHRAVNRVDSILKAI